MPANKEAQKLIYKSIKENHPSFSHTNALYLDLEGTKMLNLFWPQKSGKNRFKYLNSMNPGFPMSNSGLNNAIKEFDIKEDDLRWIVVFRGNLPETREKFNFYNIFNEKIFHRAEWIDLKYELNGLPLLKEYIRERKFSHVITHEPTNTTYNLENLEEAFGIKRPISLCSSKNIIDGEIGGMKSILRQIQNWESGQADDSDIKKILNYCKFDVESMFKILKKSQKCQ